MVFTFSSHPSLVVSIDPVTSRILTIPHFPSHTHRLFFFFQFYLFIYFLYNIVLVLPNIDMNLPWVYMCSHPEPPSHLPPHPIPLGHPSAPALSNVSCIEPRLVIRFTYDNLHISMPFSHIILPSPSPT